MKELESTAEATGKTSAEKEMKLGYLLLDLSSFQSTIDFVHAFKEKNLPLHIFINSAAVYSVPYNACMVTDLN